MVNIFPAKNSPGEFIARDASKKLMQQLNLNFMSITNKTYCIGKYDMPYVTTNLTELPDYIALYGEPGQYHRTNNTCVAFYQYESLYDDLYGIFNAIYYDNHELQAYYLNRFAGVPCFIAPDFSICGDAPHIENLYRVFRARVVSVWLTLKLGSNVIPNVTYSSSASFSYMLDGMEDCDVVAFSTKRVMRSKEFRSLTKQAVQYTVDRLPLDAIVVYSVNANLQPVYDLFDYAIAHNVKIVIPDNTLRMRNMKLQEAA